MDQLTSLDLHYLIKELQVLIDSKIDKVFKSEKAIFIQAHLPRTGKRYLTIRFPSLLYLSEQKDELDESEKFGISIRKHLKNTRIREISQVAFERIVKIGLENKENKLYLYIELFSPGNLILVNSDNKIVMASTYKGFGSRMIRPGTTYEYPKKDFNLLDLKEKDLDNLFKKSDKSSVVITLATDLGLGGNYAEELCRLAEIDKKKLTLDSKELKRLKENILKLINEEKKINDQLSEVHTKKNLDIKKEKEMSKIDKKKEQIMGIIRQQEQVILGLEKSIAENQEKGERIYEKYMEIDKIIKDMKTAKTDHSWEDIKKHLKGHRVVKNIDEKKKVMTLEI